MKVIVVVDCQNDFIDGVLGTPEAVATVPKIVNYLKDTVDEDTYVFFTRDTHRIDYMDTMEGKALPVVHCIYDTHGWEINKSIFNAVDKFKCKTIIIDKPTFGSLELASYITTLPEKVESITFVGFCTGICVMSNAVICKANFYNSCPIIVKEDLCACVSPETHKNAIEAMKLCQIEIQ